MNRHANSRTSASALMGLPVVTAQGRVLGRVRELAVHAEKDSGHIAVLLIARARSRGKSLGAVEVAGLSILPSGALQMREGLEVNPVDTAQYLLLERDLLDQQIIDVHGHKVVRVNDVDLSWEEHGAGTRLRISEVEVGLRGAVRRLLKGLPRGLVASISDKVPPRIIPWEFVDLIERDPARRVRLKIEQNRLAQMHPSDIADILEELAPAEREAVFASLDEEVAAEALEEVEPKLQKALIEGLDSERVAEIVEEMDPGAAADLLAELSDERSEAILEEMGEEERQEVEELLEFSENSAAGRMTTDYVGVSDTSTVGDAVQALRAFEGDIDTVTEVYLVDDDDKPKGVVTVARLLVALPDTPLRDLAATYVVSSELHTRDKVVAELFDKYNLRSLPVLDGEGKIAGVIHAEQVITQLREE